MNFLLPGAFLLALLLPVLVIFYLLKLHRDERLVSSTYLWRQMVRDIEANVPWQKLRRNLLLFIQLLFLAVLILAIARPYRYTQGIPSQTSVLIFDTSASMAATDVPPSRIEAAKAAAHRFVDQLPAGARVTLIAASEKPLTLLSLSADRRLIHQTIDQIQATSGGSDLGIALQIANAIASRQPDAQTIVLSDGNAMLPERSTLAGALQFIPIGSRSENQAIQLLTLRVDPHTQAISAYAQVANYGENTASRRLALYADGAIINVFDLEIPPQGEKSVVASDILSTTQTVEARLLSDEGIIDFLASDDRAFAVTRLPEPLTVYYYGEGNLFLENALRLIPRLELVKPEADQVAELQPDLSIFDSVAPPSLEMTSGNLLIINPLQSTTFFSVTGSLSMPVPVPAAPQDMLLTHVNLDGVNILDAAQVVLPTWGRAIILDGQEQRQTSDPLLFAGEIEGRRIAVITFDLLRSDLPLQVAFPILISNLIGWLTPGLAAQTPAQLSPGEALVIRNPQAASGANDSIQITRPDGLRSQLTFVDGQAVFADTSQLGVYRLDWGEAESLLFAVNLFSPQESDLQPRDTLAVAHSGAEGSETLEELARREYWRPIALLALLLLFLEWLVYHRPTLLMLRQRVRDAFPNYDQVK